MQETCEVTKHLIRTTSLDRQFSTLLYNIIKHKFNVFFLTIAKRLLIRLKKKEMSVWMTNAPHEYSEVSEGQ